MSKLIIKLMAKEIKALRKEIESRKAGNTSVVTANKILSEENVKLRNFIEQIKASNQRLSDELNDARTIKTHHCPAIREDMRNIIERKISILNHLKTIDIHPVMNDEDSYATNSKNRESSSEGFCFIDTAHEVVAWFSLLFLYTRFYRV